MPAHITHELFAEEAFKHAFDDATLGSLSSHRPCWVFGAQGPDFFLHNQRTSPTGLVFGRLLHNEGYGTFVGRLIEAANALNEAEGSCLGAFVLGFVTHAVLDRITHPYINYFSGWVDRRDPESVRYTNCHPFLERIIDVLLLHLRRNTRISDYDFLSRVDLGDELPGPLREAVVQALEHTFREYEGQDDLALRVRNAYADTIGFYRFTNPPAREHLAYAVERDGGGADPTRRLLALFHPDGLPELDYLNGARKAWNHPGDSKEIHHESFVDLFEAAIERTTAPLESALAALRGEGTMNGVERAVGNENLSDGKPRKAKRRLTNVSPLPLDEVLATLYTHIGTTAGSGSNPTNQ